MVDISGMDHAITMTSGAADRIKALIDSEKEGDSSYFLRLSVSAGGCAGFSYGFELDNRLEMDDITIETDGIRLVIDPVSAELLSGSTLDYIDELGGAYFRVSNPRATSSCGCGTSFNLDMGS